MDKFDALRQPLIETLTGGNHLASILIGRLGSIALLDQLPSYKLPLDPNDTSTQELLKGDTWDIWIAWRSIMRLADAMEQAQLLEKPPHTKRPSTIRMRHDGGPCTC